MSISEPDSTKLDADSSKNTKLDDITGVNSKSLAWSKSTSLTQEKNNKTKIKGKHGFFIDLGIIKLKGLNMLQIPF
ncbi:hypothetical protein GCM10007028_16030 [Algibacter mikhailovii]|uniref:Uncharacterized protein n=1 Tax=Algibacter mikhailovii TaxID=425498 RepID=A0A918R0W5_9FLAO|nr:hypothetical protein GCM10007028_16030 [Algibacter mikhailovii]